MFKSPKQTAPAPAAPPPSAPTMADASVAATGANSRGGAIGGLASTLATGATGDLTTPNLARKKLTGE
jgi:hypothetical protein